MGEDQKRTKEATMKKRKEGGSSRQTDRLSSSFSVDSTVSCHPTSYILQKTKSTNSNYIIIAFLFFHQEPPLSSLDSHRETHTHTEFKEREKLHISNCLII
ncbi:hypothetical protein L6452_01890 [Arctium lappa]|uniref:Uncharacterized protein n=1 Tax=Arctium lappa TaxID=4217 RepID=A0ACB9FHW0_ARCLA|nr:hypothetical protein L6452_01890 [Arctium lappa]